MQSPAGATTSAGLCAFVYLCAKKKCGSFFRYDHFAVCQFCPILHQYFDTENEENPVILQPEFNKTSKTKD
ncbi:MAG: hypothetical protein IKP30_08825 [Bacteroidaceae bacterium]|nr:hypothetical protein [Bacteroidaceae bacterium]